MLVESAVPGVDLRFMRQTGTRCAVRRGLGVGVSGRVASGRWAHSVPRRGRAGAVRRVGAGVGVVVLDVGVEDGAGVLFAGDEEPVGAFAADGGDLAFRVRVHPRCLRCSGHGVEGVGELRVPVGGEVCEPVSGVFGGRAANSRVAWSVVSVVSGDWGDVCGPRLRVSEGCADCAGEPASRVWGPTGVRYECPHGITGGYRVSPALVRSSRGSALRRPPRMAARGFLPGECGLRSRQFVFTSVRRNST